MAYGISTALKWGGQALSWGKGALGGLLKFGAKGLAVVGVGGAAVYGTEKLTEGADGVGLIEGTANGLRNYINETVDQVVGNLGEAQAKSDLNYYAEVLGTEPSTIQAFLQGALKSIIQLVGQWTGMDTSGIEKFFGVVDHEYGQGPQENQQILSDEFRQSLSNELGIKESQLDSTIARLADEIGVSTNRAKVFMKQYEGDAEGLIDTISGQLEITPEEFKQRVQDAAGKLPGAEGAEIGGESADAEPEVEQSVERRLQVTTDGIYQGMITGASYTVGAPLSAANWVIDVLDIDELIDGKEMDSEENFGTVTWFKRNLTDAYNGYNGMTGIEIPKPADDLDHTLHMGGNIAGQAATAFGASAAVTRATGLTAQWGTAGQLSGEAMEQTRKLAGPAAAPGGGTGMGG